MRRPLQSNLAAFVLVFLLLAEPALSDPKLASQEDAATWPAGQVERSQLSTERATDFEFSDVDVANITGWLKWLRVELPVTIRGELAGWLWAQRSSQGWLRLGDYRIEGEITSKQLTVEDWLVDDATVRFGYADGTWYVGNLTGTVRQEGREQPIGKVAAAAKLATAGGQQISLKGKIGPVDLSQLLQAFDLEVDLGQGQGDLVFEGDVPLTSFTDLSRWNAQTVLEVAGVQLGGSPPVELSAQASLKEGLWLVPDGRLGVGQQSIPFTGSGRLDADLPFQLAVVPTLVGLSELVGDAGFTTLAKELAGAVEISADLNGTAISGLQHANAKIMASRLNIGPLPLEAVDLTAEYESSDDDRSTRFEIGLGSVQIAGGWLKGQAGWTGNMSLSHGWPGSAELSFGDINLQLFDGIFGIPPLAGKARGNLDWQTQQINDAWAWSLKSSLDCAQFQVAEVAVGDTQLSLAKRFDSDTAELGLSSSQGGINADLEVQLASVPDSSLLHTQFSEYLAKGKVTAFRSAIPLGSQAESRAPFVVSGGFELQGETGKLLNRGEARLESLQMQLGQETLDLDTAHLLVSPSEFRLASFRVCGSQGRVAGAGRFSRDGSGQHLLNLRVAEVQVEPYVRLLPLRELRGTQGLVSFEMKLSKSGTIRSLSKGWTGECTGAVQDITYRAVSVGQLQLDGQVADETISANLSGSLLSGDVKVRGQLPVATFQAEKHDLQSTPLELNARLSKLDLQRLHRLLGGSRLLPVISGLASVELRGAGTEVDNFELRTEVNLPRLDYGRRTVGKDLRLMASYQAGKLQVQSLRGELVRGRIEAAGLLRFDSSDLSRPPSGSLQFDASQLQVAELVGLLFPEFANQFSGTANYRGRIRVGPTLSISGAAHASQVSAFALPLQQLRGTLGLSLAADGSLESLVSSDLHGTAIGGRIAGAVQLRGGASYQLDASARISGGRLDQLSEGLGFSHIVGTGRFDSRVELRSKRISSLNALSGAVSVDFGQSDAQSLPLLSDLGAYAPLLTLASTDITGGTLHAKIGGGQLRIQDLFLNSNAFWLVADGQVGLADSRLDLNALLQTGGGLEQQLANSGLRKAAVLLLPQAAAVAQISDLLSNRSLYFHIGGNANKPVIQARLAQTASRLLLDSVRRQLLVAPTALPSASD